MRRDGSDIPAAELEVLATLWRIGKGTVRELYEAWRRATGAEPGAAERGP